MKCINTIHYCGKVSMGYIYIYIYIYSKTNKNLLVKQIILHFKCAYKHLGNIKQNIMTFHNMTFFVFFDGPPICVFYIPYYIIYLHLIVTS